LDLFQDRRLDLIKQALGREQQLYLVGGAVRDSLLRLQNKGSSDLDLACSLPAKETLRLLDQAGIRTVDVALQHSTVLAVPVADQPGIEITSLRSRESDGSIVEGTSLEQDLSLRDFTVNSLAICAWSGELKDPHGFLKDIESKVLRACGDPSLRIKEDPLRMIRAARFKASHNFQLNEELFLAIRENSELIRNVSVERVRDELSKLLVAEDPGRGLLLLLETGILSIVLPEVARLRGVEQNCYHKDDVFIHTLEVIGRSEPELVTRLAALFHDISKPETLSIDSAEEILRKGSNTIRHFYCHESVGARRTEEILERLKFPGRLVSSVSNVVKHHMRPLECGKSGLRRILRDLDEDYDVWRKLKEADASSCAADPEMIAEQLRDFDLRIEKLRAEPEVHKFSNLAVNGKDLIGIGFQEGPELGETLAALHEEVLDDPKMNEKEILLSRASKILNSEAVKPS